MSTTAQPIDLSDKHARLDRAPVQRTDDLVRADSPAVTSYLEVVQHGADAQDRLQHGLDLLPELIPGCQHASATTRLVRGLEVRAATDDTSRRADDLQHQLREGPVLQALRTGHSVIAHDLRTETRWPHWNTQVAGELMLGSVLSIVLASSSWPVATLNLYSTSPTGLTHVDHALLHVLAVPLSSTLLEACVPGITHGE